MESVLYQYIFMREPFNIQLFRSTPASQEPDIKGKRQRQRQSKLVKLPGSGN